MTEPPSRELELIRAIRGAAARQHPGIQVGIGDDCAVLELAPGERLLATTDLLLEDVHFRRRYAAPGDIGWKALAVNLSDVAAMGGRPRWALVALACPSNVRADEVGEFYEAAFALADEHGVAVVGGDTSSSRAGWVVNVTLLGTTAGVPVLRSTAKPGHVVAVTGALGRARAGLAVLDGDAVPTSLGAEPRDEVVGVHLRPRPRVREGQWLGRAVGVTAMIDLSDGLATDLRHIVDESGVGARVEIERVPVAPSARAVADVTGDDAVAWATSGGEDYELLVTCQADAFERVVRGLREATGTTLTAVGEIVNAERGLTFVDRRGDTVPVAAGFEHFVTGVRDDR
jgi:thiamine-monophosphate kinase